MQMVTCIKIGTGISLLLEMTLKIAICISIPRATFKPSPSLYPNPDSIWSLPWEAICSGNCFWVQQVSILYSVTNQASCPANETICICLYVTSFHLASYDYVLFEKSLAAFAIFQGKSQQTPLALQIILEQVLLLLVLFSDLRLLEP